MKSPFTALLVSVSVFIFIDSTVFADDPEVSCYSMVANWLPDEDYYVFEGSNLFELSKKPTGEWVAAWGVVETSRDLNGRVQYVITWENGSDEIALQDGDQYQIQKHSGDKSQVGKKVIMKRAQLPKSAVPALNAAKKLSFPLKLSTKVLADVNKQLDALDSDLSKRQLKLIGLPFNSGRATDSRGVLRRMASVREVADTLNALEIIRDFNK
jgi:hypothetical protein